MKVLILNGSPAGDNSITLQTVEYIKIFFPEHDYETINVGQRIKAIEKDFSSARASLEAADLILFAYPVYTFLVPAQLHRFIELIRESGADVAGKYATQISTSKHFYDTTAHRFIQDSCADLGLRYLRGLSADMDDILTEQGRKDAREFFSFVLWNIERGFCEEPSVQRASAPFEPVIASEVLSNDPGVESTGVQGSTGPVMSGSSGLPSSTGPVMSGNSELQGSTGPVMSGSSGLPSDRAESLAAAPKQMRVALVTDCDAAAPAPGLAAMIRRFQKKLSGEIVTVNLREFPFSGGCLGCFNCASDGKCIYKDGFDDYLRQNINSADAVVYAFTIKDHSMGYRFKLYDDRQFCNGHRTVTMGRPVGYLVDGALSEEENVRTLIEARAQVGGNYLAGAATDEADPDSQIDRLAETLEYAVRNHYTQPKNFYGVGGLKIFRDLIYQMQGLMKEDHRFYKKHGFYDDFPQKKKGRIVGMYLVGAMMKSKKLSKKFSMTDGMMLSYRKMLEKAKEEKRLLQGS